MLLAYKINFPFKTYIFVKWYMLNFPLRERLRSTKLSFCKKKFNLLSLERFDMYSTIFIINTIINMLTVNHTRQ
jgi:hypothetical protein